MPVSSVTMPGKASRAYASPLLQDTVASQYFFEKTRVQGGGEAFLGDAVLGRVRPQEGQGEAAEQSQILGSVPLLHAVAILTEVHVELPMQVVLDAPVVPQPAGVVFRAGPLVADEIADLRSGFPLHGPLTVTHADGGQAGPGVRMTAVSFDLAIKDQEVS